MSCHKSYKVGVCVLVIHNITCFCFGSNDKDYNIQLIDSELANKEIYFLSCFVDFSFSELLKKSCSIVYIVSKS